LISRPDFSNWVLRGYSLPALLIQRRIEDCVETDRSCARNLLDEHVCKISKIQPFADFWNVTTAQTNFPAACVWFYKLLKIVKPKVILSMSYLTSTAFETKLDDANPEILDDDDGNKGKR